MFFLTADVDSDDMLAAADVEKADARNLSSRSQEGRDAGSDDFATNSFDEGEQKQDMLYGDRNTDRRWQL